MLFSSLKLSDIYEKVKEWFGKNKQEEERDDLRKKTNATRLNNYYNGNQEQYLDGWGFQDPDTNKWIISPMFLNVTKKIIDKVNLRAAVTAFVFAGAGK